MKVKDVKKRRIETAKIIKRNLELMNKNPNMIQEIADCIIANNIGAFD